MTVATTGKSTVDEFTMAQVLNFYHEEQPGDQSEILAVASKLVDDWNASFWALAAILQAVIRFREGERNLLKHAYAIFFSIISGQEKCLLQSPLMAETQEDLRQLVVRPGMLDDLNEVLKLIWLILIEIDDGFAVVSLKHAEFRANLGLQALEMKRYGLSHSIRLVRGSEEFIEIDAEQGRVWELLELIPQYLADN